MEFKPDERRRRSLRWRGYDYERSGAYFVTLCTQGRASLFGEIAGAEMRMNEAGRMIREVWDELPSFYPGVEIDEFVVMPNHVHGIVVLVGSRVDRAELSWDKGGGLPVPAETDEAQRLDPTARMSLSDVVHRFKSMTTKRYSDRVKRQRWPPFPGRLWQRSFHDRVIRDDDDWNRIRQYIVDNPAQWAIDRENPDARPGEPPGSSASSPIDLDRS